MNSRQFKNVRLLPSGLSTVLPLSLMVACAHPVILTGQTLVWEQHQGYRSAKLNVPPGGRTGFTLLPAEQTGILFSNQLSYTRSETNQNLLNGAGLAAGDMDGDGLCDLYFCNLEGTNALYRNRGQWRFDNVTSETGTACAHQTSRGAVFADLNGDGALDLLVSSLGGPNACLMNDGKGRFADVTQKAGMISKPAGAHTYALADVDGDGDLDVYLANYGENSILRSGGMIAIRTVQGKQVVTGRYASRLKIAGGRLFELGEPDALYLNNGQGVFTAVSWTDGTFLNDEGRPLRTAPYDMGLSAMFRDLNGDLAPDLYVCNDFQTPDRIWINDGRGRFRPIATEALRSTCHFSMNADFADIDRDGHDDFVVSDMLSRFHRLRLRQIGATNPPPEQVMENWDRHQIHRNTFFLNRGDGTYAEIANFAGLDASDWTWCMIFVDVDLDGYEDVLVTNGHAYDTQDLDMTEKVTPTLLPTTGLRPGKNLKDYPPLITPNVAFRNRGNRTFEEVGKAWGFDATQVSHGMCLADLDNDGDLDVAINALWRPALVYRNESSAPRVAVRLKGRGPNTRGIGAKIKVTGGAVPVQTQEMLSGGRYLASDEPLRVFAAGQATNLLTIEVTWRSGLQSVLRHVPANYVYEIDEAHAQPRAKPTPSAEPKPWFQDFSAAIAHQHFEAPFNDFERQPLLHKKFSQLGPGVAWYDLNADGFDDLVIGSGKGAVPTVFRNDGKGRFVRWETPLLRTPVPDDITGVIGWTPAAGQRGLLLGLSNFESAENASSQLLRFGIRAGSSPVIEAQPPLPLSQAAIGGLAVADLDGDGDLDVFVAGRVLPGKYPEPAPSLLFRNHNGQLQLDTVNSAVLKDVGLVSAAVLSDLTGDGLPELVLACEWGPIRIFNNANGTLRDATREWGVAGLAGWWNGIAAGDVNGDGQLDLIAANWGLNSSYRQPSPQQPVRLFHGDFDANGTVDLVEACLEPDSSKWLPWRDMTILSQGLPAIRTRIASHAQYAQADVSAVLGTASARAVEAKNLASMVFLNRGGRLEPASLPDQAQFAPAFGVTVADWDGDGHEDVFLSQNFFATRPEEPRLDAGRGLLLRGLGDGQFAPVPGQESGIIIYGEQRGSAVADFDADGRPDLVVTQNSAATRLFRNDTAKPGVRVRLQGPPGNPDGIGAVIRLKFAERLGPARAIHAGSGYWSQDSSVVVLATPDPATAIWVRWPGGRVTTTPITPGASSITVKMEG